MSDAGSGLDDLTRELTGSICLLLEGHHVRAALMLILASVDILGALESEDGRASRLTFLRWADAYLDPPSVLGCESIDLYSARSGMLHAMAGQTDLSRQGQAAEMVWMTEPNTLPERSRDPKIRVVHVAALWVAFRDGVNRFAEELALDRARMATVEKNLTGTYATRVL